MATIRIVLGIICLAFFGWAVEPSGYFLKGEEFRSLALAPILHQRVSVSKLPTQNSQLIIAIAQLQLGVREATGKNDGAQVEKYLQYTNNKKGAPWCAAFVSWVFGQAGLAQPKTAWSPDLFPLARQTINPLPADVFGIYFSKLGRIAHCGLVENRKNDWIYTIEGNTNTIGGREGDGVYRKIRHLKTIACFAKWINETRKEGLR